ncbi:MAG: acyltransferase family protein [Eubacterium sp.]
MALSFALIGVLCLYQIRFSFFEKDKTPIYEDYMSLVKTNSIKGIFILVVFFSHVSQCITLSDTFLTKLFNLINYNIVGQSMVSMFMLYSGYAVMLSAVNKGKGYVKLMPKNRILKVLLHFDIAVLLFLLLQTIIGQKFSFVKILLSLIGWDSIGNSNWYIFVILCLYLFSWISFMICRDKHKAAVALTFVLTAVLIVVLHKYKEDFWWDTAILYPIGMTYYLCKDKIDKIIKEHGAIYAVSLLVCIALWVLFYKFRGNDVALVFKHIFFAFIVLFATMKVQIHNKILNFFGKHLFSIFILQRLPMILLTYFGIDSQPVIYVALTAVVTIIICVPYDLLMAKIDSVLFTQKRKETISNA